MPLQGGCPFRSSLNRHYDEVTACIRPVADNPDKEDTMNRPQPLRPDRIRVIERPFGWIPFRILTSGLLAQLGVPARALYFFLCLVADSNGLSFYGDYRTTMLLKLAGVELRMARVPVVIRYR